MYTAQVICAPVGIALQHVTWSGVAMRHNLFCPITDMAMQMTDRNCSADTRGMLCGIDACHASSIAKQTDLEGDGK